MLPRSCLRFRLKYIIGAIVSLFVLNYFGVFTHMFELDFHKDFNYPMLGDVRKYASQQRRGQRPDFAPINVYNYSFLETAQQKCLSGGDETDPNDPGTILAPRLVFIIKSAMENFGRRNAIRSSWGFEKRLSDVLIRTVFMLGVPEPYSKGAGDMQRNIDLEIDQYQDIVQSDFHDSYYNNTIKIMMSFKWAIQYCPRSKFYMFVDDDFYISAKNVLRFVRNPLHYPEYLEEADETLRKLARRLSQSDMANSSAVEVPEALSIINAHKDQHTVNGKDAVQTIQKFIDRKTAEAAAAKNTLNDIKTHKSRQLKEMELADDVKLFSGFVFSSWPHRHKSSKWYVTLEDYPWHMWPPYVTGGAFILSREALNDLYYVSMFTKHFRYVFLQISISQQHSLLN